MKEECTSVVAWEQASGRRKREKIGSGRGGGEAGDEPLPLFPCLFRTPPPLDF